MKRMIECSWHAIDTLDRDRTIVLFPIGFQEKHYQVFVLLRLDSYKCALVVDAFFRAFERELERLVL